jgi:hypothetical protein
LGQNISLKKQFLGVNLGGMISLILKVVSNEKQGGQEGGKL